MKLTLKALIPIAAALLSTPIYAKDLAPEDAHRLTTLEIVHKLRSGHYEKRTIDDAMSERILSSYLDRVDPNRQVFLQKDVDGFSKKYSKDLDDAIKKGDSQAGYEIFNHYQARLISLLEDQIANMEKRVKGFDYTKDDVVVVDRSEQPWPASMNEVKDIWYKRLKSSALSLKLAGKEQDDIIKLLKRRYQNQLDRTQNLNSEDVYQLYMNSFTQLYDPHTNYLSPENSKNFDIAMSLKLNGIGAVLRQKDEFTKVVRLIHAGPAAKQGDLQPSDRITAVAQGAKGEFVDVVGWRLGDVVNLIRGPKNTVVKLEVIPAKSKSDDKRKVISIVRDEVKLEEQSVQKSMLNIKDSKGVVRKIGVLDVPTFYSDFEAHRRGDRNYKSTSRDSARLLGELINEGAEGIIIDLRDNGGGSLSEAEGLTSLFIDRGPTVQIKLASNHTQTRAKYEYSPYYEGPVVVLINRLSASASEIFSGALQDYQRAIVVGSQTFGKGTVQSLERLNNGRRLKLTNSKFYRISGDSTQNRGVIPDIKLPRTYDHDIVGESTLDNAMAWDQIAPAPHRRYSNYSHIIDKLQSKSDARTDQNPDFVYLNKRTEHEAEIELDTLSLNEKQRIKKREDEEAYYLSILNEKRVAKGEKPLKELEDEDEDEQEEQEANDKTANAIDPEDPFLIEAGQILLDNEQLQKSSIVFK